MLRGSIARSKNRGDAMRLTRLAVVVSIAAGATAALAQNNSDMAYGIQIGAPLQLAECPKLVAGSTAIYKGSNAPCIQEIFPKAAPGNFATGGMIAFPPGQWPAQAAGGRIGVSIVAGNVAVLVVPTSGFNAQQRIYDDLVAKYGQPASRATIPMQNAIGARIEGIGATWHAGSVDVLFNGVIGKVDQGQLLIGTPAGIAERQARIDAVLKGRQTPL